MAEPPAAPPEDEAARFMSAHPDIETVELLLPDSNGVLRGKWMPASHLDGLYRDGLSLAKSVFALDAWGRDVLATGLYHEAGDRDGIVRPVAGTLRRVPWAARPTAQVLARMADEDGTPFFADPRAILETALAPLTAGGLTPVVAFELEFYLLAPENAADGPTPVVGGPGPDRTHIYALADLDAHGALLADIESAGRAQGVATDTVISEAAPGQFEVNLHHVADAIGAADQALLLRRIVRETARAHGLRATFMAKPFAGRSGNGMHVHLSLADGAGANAFATGDGDALLKRALSGLIATMADATLPLISTHNGFRRLAAPYAPSRALWGENNRYVALRLPRAAAPARRIEHRVAGADAHPHLVLAMLLAGIIEGLESDLALPAPVTGDVAAADGVPLPASMGEALARFAASDRIAGRLGARWRDFYAKVKRQELDTFLDHVPRLEIETYL